MAQMIIITRRRVACRIRISVAYIPFQVVVFQCARLMVWMTLVNVTAVVNQVIACAKRNKQCYPFTSLLIMLESK